MKYIAGFFLDDTQKPSMNRLVTFGWTFGTLSIWIFASIHQGTLVSIPLEVCGLLLSVWGFKVYQKQVEGKTHG